MEIPVADDPAVEKPRVVVLMNGTPAGIVETNGTPTAIVENRSRRRLPLATTTDRRNFDGGPDHDLRQGGPTTTTPGTRDGNGRAGEIALMTDRDAIIECTTAETKSDGPVSHIAATTTKKLRVFSRSSGASRSPDAARRGRRF